MPYLTWKSFDWRNGALPVFEAIKDKEYVFFLDSSLCNNYLGRYSFLGYEPFYILKDFKEGNPFNRLRELTGLYKLGSKKNILPFLGGAVGYFSYDLGFCLENIKESAAVDLGLPGLFLGFYDTIIAVDHFKGKLYVISTGFPETKYSLAKRRAQERLKQFITDLSGLKDRHPEDVRPQEIAAQGLDSNFTKDKYLGAVRTAKEYIKNGDIYQVNLSQRFSAQTKMTAPGLYRKLRRVSPSSFSAYLDCGDFQILSSSPERFLYFDGKKVFSRPMKGTRPRGKCKIEDSRLRQELLKSAKDKAELIMIVDLLRNDLGRVCKYGSVRVSSMRALEVYSTVYQATATIEGFLHRDKDRVDLLKACFPGGSITGCPKIRAMQIIEELEPTKRSIYTGSLGYLGFNNTMDLNILIRTILKKDDRIYFQVGGGIVADSEAENEYAETLAKAQGILRAIGK